jgi:hypothetical protein
MLTCQLVVKNAAGNEVYNQSRPIVMAKDAYEKATPEQQDDDEFFDKLLWKDVAGQFKEMAGEVPLTPPSGATGTATPAAGAATSTDPPPAAR